VEQGAENPCVPGSIPKKLEHLLLSLICLICSLVKTVDFNAVKRQEGRSRMTALRIARRSGKAAKAIQYRSSLIKNSAKWDIVNLKEFAHSMSQWA